MNTKRKNFYKKGMEEFQLNIKVELQKYKSLICSDSKKADEAFIKKYNDQVLETNGEKLIIPDTYTEWEKQIEEKYSKYTKDKLKDFLFYLESGTNRRRGIKEVLNLSVVPAMASVLALSLEEIVEKMKYGIVGYFIGIVAVIAIIMIYVWNTDKMFFEYDNYVRIYETYRNIIDDLYKRKYEDE